MIHLRAVYKRHSLGSKTHVDLKQKDGEKDISCKPTQRPKWPRYHQPQEPVTLQLGLYRKRRNTVQTLGRARSQWRCARSQEAGATRADSI